MKKGCARRDERVEMESRMKERIAVIIFFILLMFMIIYCLNAQTISNRPESLEESKLKVFLDCPGCDTDYMQKEIPFVSFVADQREAQVLVVITSRKTETGDEEFILIFTGQAEFEGIKDTLKYYAPRTDKPEEVKRGLAQILKLGLMRYVSKTPAAGRINIDFTEKVKPTSVVDKWNFWVFSLSGNTFLNGEKYYKGRSFFGSFSANRVTPELKIRMSLGGMYQKSEFTVEDTIIKSSSDSLYFGGLIVKSINDHWSMGSFFSAGASTYSNVRLSLSPAPAIEYDLFPYSQSTRKQLRFLYRLGITSVRYREETIFFKTYENLWREALSVTLELKEKWGTISASLEGSHYFHDFSKNRLELEGEVSLRIFEGLSFNIRGNGSRIRDQLSLVRGGASLEEVLLRRKQLATTYNYFFSVGLSYTFGSIRSNIVNPRFGEGGRSISIRFGL